MKKTNPVKLFNFTQLANIFGRGGGSKDVVDLVEKTPCAIGYSGLAYATVK